MWTVVCLAATWHNNPDVRWSATRDNAHEKLYVLLKDPVPEVISLNSVHILCIIIL